MGLFSRHDKGKVIRKNKDGSVERMYKNGIKEKRRTTKIQRARGKRI